MYSQDKRIVLTLDAGGSTFTFSAIQGCQEVISPLSLQAHPNDLNKCLDALIEGFSHAIKELKAKNKNQPCAISFAFPGPADYKNGVIGGDLPNFPAFRAGVPLGEILKRRFHLPVYINNDGNLFAYGEAILGVLPAINHRLQEKKHAPIYRNLIGITMGTGFGAGVVIRDELLFGDNGCGGDIWSFRNKLYPDKIAEESVSIRGVAREYENLSGDREAGLTPKDIFYIAEGKRKGNRDAAIKAFSLLGEVAGDCIAHMLTFLDGIIVLGGGIMGASKYIVPALKKEMRSHLNSFDGHTFNRLQMQLYDLTDETDSAAFYDHHSSSVSLSPYNDKIGDGAIEETVPYHADKKTGIIVSQLGTSRAISLGAYAYALRQIDLEKK